MAGNSAIDAVNTASTSPSSVGSYDNMPMASDYYVDPNYYNRGVLHRVADWVLGYDANADYQAHQNKATSAYQDAYNKWLAEREDTKIQRTVADLEKAGLNKWLAVQNGFTTNNSISTEPSKTSATKLSEKKSASDTISKFAMTALVIAKLFTLLA